MTHHVQGERIYRGLMQIGVFHFSFHYSLMAGSQPTSYQL